LCYHKYMAKHTANSADDKQPEKTEAIRDKDGNIVEGWRLGDQSGRRDGVKGGADEYHRD
jgi:hypothetical protein